MLDFNSKRSVGDKQTYRHTYMHSYENNSAEVDFGTPCP
jgi:hypothetical protein